MTRKDYITIAEALSKSAETSLYRNCSNARRLMENIMGNLTLALHDDNPKFDAARFRQYVMRNT